MEDKTELMSRVVWRYQKTLLSCTPSHPRGSRAVRRDGLSNLKTGKTTLGSSQVCSLSQFVLDSTYLIQKSETEGDIPGPHLMQ